MQKIQKYKYYLVLLIIPLTSFFNSINQAIYNYDGFHWGLILFTAEGLNLGEKPFVDVFIHYGILTTKFNAIILKLFKDDFIYIFAASSLAYSFSIFIQTLFVLRLSNIYFAVLGGLIIFFLHPYANFPSHAYYVYFLFNLFLLLRFSNNDYLKYLSYFLLSTIIFFSESFVVASILFFLFDTFLLIFFEKYSIRSKPKTFSIRLFFYLLPILIFISYLNLQNLYSSWTTYNDMGKIFFQIIDKNLLEAFISFFSTLKDYALGRIFTHPNWMIYLILLLFNVFFITKFIFHKFNKKISENDLVLVTISFASIVLLYQTIHSITIFKFACSLTIGLIVLLRSISKINNNENIIIITIILFLYSFSSFGFTKNENNRMYVYKYQKINHVKNNYFKYFKTQKWDRATWHHLMSFDENIKNFKNNCNISSGANLSEDGIISVIMRNNLDLEQLIPWYQNLSISSLNRYYDTLWRHFDPNYKENIISKINSSEIIIYTDRSNYPIINLGGQSLNLESKMNFIKLPYSYQNKDKIILFPKNCNNI